MIYILEYPSLKLYRLLRKGAAKSYSNICFNTNGDKLASVGGDPDYMLTIWDWKKEKIVLRSKAFSQVHNITQRSIIPVDFLLYRIYSRSLLLQKVMVF